MLSKILICHSLWAKLSALEALCWGFEVAHPCSDPLHVALPMSLPRAAWPMISSTEQVSFSAKWQKLSYSCVSCIFILPFRCCHTKPSKLSPRQPDFRWSNCWNLILIEWSWIIILATQDLRIGASRFWRVRSKALRWKMGAGGFILQSLLHLALPSTGKPIAWLKGYSESTHKVLQSLDVSQARINTWNSTWLDKSL